MNAEMLKLMRAVGIAEQLAKSRWASNGWRLPRRRKTGPRRERQGQISPSRLATLIRTESAISIVEVRGTRVQLLLMACTPADSTIAASRRATGRGDRRAGASPGSRFNARARVGVGGAHSPGFTVVFLSERRQQRNRLPPIPPINREVAIHCEHPAVRQQFGHADKTSVGERHRCIRIALHQIPYP